MSKFQRGWKQCWKPIYILTKIDENRCGLSSDVKITFLQFLFYSNVLIINGIKMVVND